MKRFVKSSLILTLSAVLASSGSSLFAGPAGDVKTLPTHLHDTTYSVTLTGTPANQLPFTLTAGVMQLPPDTMARGTTPLVDPRLRYTFTAHRTWPCADTNVTIINNSPQSAVSWSPQGVKAGEYTAFTVHVTTLQLQDPRIKIPNLPAVIGDANLSTAPLSFTVRPTSAGLTGGWNANPPSGAAGPLTANVTYTVNNPPADTRFRIKVFCVAGSGWCQPTSETSQNNPSSTLTTTIPAASPVLHFESSVDQIHTPDCVWVASIQNTSTATSLVYWTR
jgi:hypothetical protein